MHGHVACTCSTYGKTGRGMQSARCPYRIADLAPGGVQPGLGGSRRATQNAHENASAAAGVVVVWKVDALAGAGVELGVIPADVHRFAKETCCRVVAALGAAGAALRARAAHYSPPGAVRLLIAV